MASSKREKELARMRADRQAARRAAVAARRRQRTLVLSGVAAAVVVAVIATLVVVKTRGGSKDTLAASPTPSASPSAAADTTAAPNPTTGCAYTSSGTAARKVAKPPTAGFERTKAQTAVLTTSAGPVTLELASAKAPCTVNSFTSLAKAAFFNDTPCHRLTTAGIFVLQCGDPTGKGSGGPGYVFPEENLMGAVYKRGTVAMARTNAKGTNGSQFFLVYKDSPSLPADYTPFGTIVGGLDVLDKIAKAGTDDKNGAGDGAPKTPVQLKTVVVKS